MMEVKENRKLGVFIEDGTGEDEKLKELKSNLNFLIFNYWPKRTYTEKFDIEEEIKEKIVSGPEPSADELDFEECRKLLYSINLLMEELGHTKFEKKKMERTKI